MKYVAFGCVSLCAAMGLFRASEILYGSRKFTDRPPGAVPKTITPEQSGIVVSLLTFLASFRLSASVNRLSSVRGRQARTAQS